MLFDLRQSMAGAELLVLLDPGDVGGTQLFPNLVRPVPHHHEQPLAAGLARGSKDPSQQRLPRHLLQHLGACRVHPGALARGKYHRRSGQCPARHISFILFE